jgi:hypothetical protein
MEQADRAIGTVTGAPGQAPRGCARYATVAGAGAERKEEEEQHDHWRDERNRDVRSRDCYQREQIGGRRKWL